MTLLSIYPMPLLIAAESPDGTVTAVQLRGPGATVFCAGHLLHAHYADDGRVAALIAAGDLSRLAPTVATCARDWPAPPQFHPSAGALLDRATALGAHAVMLWRGGQWTCAINIYGRSWARWAQLGESLAGMPQPVF